MPSDERGQASVEWTALTTVLALALAAVLALAGPRLPGEALAREVLSKIACAASLASDCARGEIDPLTAAYGAEVGPLVGAVAPRISYEAGMRALPVDPRSCRSTDCSDATRLGAVSASDAGEPVTAFVRVIDCRGASPADRLLARAGLDAYRPHRAVPQDLGSAVEQSGVPCVADEAGNLYIQFWFFYPYSNTHLPGEWMGEAFGAGEVGGHVDDWETYQVKITPEGRFARASSHQGFNYAPDARGLLSDAGVAPREGWGPDVGSLHVSAGSHAGHAAVDPIDRHGGPERWTDAGDLRLIPLEPIVDDLGRLDFVVKPPWQRDLWLETELDRTGY
ncbi:hypothetical protein HJD18_04565 [Thermoleophilia bacterium SCSIO 60948]|nr:hypothetical protein HJD18_04565 [Thermoleophilia bacterium SCSIO 60948]